MAGPRHFQHASWPSWPWRAATARKVAGDVTVAYFNLCWGGGGGGQQVSPRTCNRRRWFRFAPFVFLFVWGFCRRLHSRPRFV